VNGRDSESTATYRTGVAVPLKFASGTNVTTPVVVLTLCVPCPATFTDVAVQVGGLWPVPHSRTEVGDIVTPAGGTSFANGLMLWDWPAIPLLVSVAGTTASGGLTDAATCPDERWDKASDTTYFTGVAVPVKVGKGSKVNVPLALAAQVPSLATVNDVVVHEASLVATAHTRTDWGSKVVPVPGESLASTVTVWFTSNAPLVVSLTTRGGPDTVTDKVDWVCCPVTSSTLYTWVVALPAKTGSGSNVTVPFAFTV
jgi:hypothetical protein